MAALAEKGKPWEELRRQKRSCGASYTSFYKLPLKSNYGFLKYYYLKPYDYLSIDETYISITDSEEPVCQSFLNDVTIYVGDTLLCDDSAHILYDL